MVCRAVAIAKREDALRILSFLGFVNFYYKSYAMFKSLLIFITNPMLCSNHSQKLGCVKRCDVHLDSAIQIR